MLHKTVIALLAVASVGLAAPTTALARGGGGGGGGGGHGGGGDGFGGGGGGFHDYRHFARKFRHRFGHAPRGRSPEDSRALCDRNINRWLAML